MVLTWCWTLHLVDLQFTSTLTPAHAVGSMSVTHHESQRLRNWDCGIFCSVGWGKAETARRGRRRRPRALWLNWQLGCRRAPKHCYRNCEPAAIINGFGCTRSSVPEQLRHTQSAAWCLWSKLWGQHWFCLSAFWTLISALGKYDWE